MIPPLEHPVTVTDAIIALVATVVLCWVYERVESYERRKATREQHRTHLVTARKLRFWDDNYDGNSPDTRA